MAVLFTLLANKPGRSSSSAGQVRVEASALLSRQLMRPGGVVGLLNVLLGNAESGELRCRSATPPPPGGLKYMWGNRGIQSNHKALLLSSNL